ncbi:MAG TPA: VWA domain-containing protein [Bryobacteraceae bacterium]|nr:VWA domain-containing protein [Bryobacteraceae bacterium]
MQIRHRLLALCASFVCLGQQPIRVDVHLVNVSFTVRDTRGALVSNLTADDFDVIEDGVPQKIAFFARSSDVPLTLGLLADVSGSQDPFVKKHEHDLKEFLKTVLTPRDRAFLLCFGNHLRLASDLTGDPAEILDGLKEFDRHKRHFPEIGPDDEERILGTAFYDAIYYSVREKLDKTDSGRRALIIFSDGEDNSSAHHMMEALEAAQTSNVLLYGVRYTETKHGHWNARNKYGRRVMARLAQDSGAADFDAREGNVRDYFKQIAEELRSSYELAYHSTNPTNDNVFRRIVVRPKVPDVKVRTKTGYYSRPDPTS